MIETPAFQSELDKSPIALTIMVPRFMNQGRYCDPLVQDTIPEATEDICALVVSVAVTSETALVIIVGGLYKPQRDTNPLLQHAVPHPLKDVDTFLLQRM